MSESQDPLDQQNIPQEEYSADEFGITESKGGRFDHLKRLLNSSLKQRYVLIIGALLLAAIIAGYYFNRATIVKEVEVTGNTFTPAEKVIKQAAVPLNTPPDSLPYLRIIKDVETLPYVKEATVQVVPPKTLLIRVSERKPVGVLADQGNQPYFDANGIVLPRVTGKAVNVPLVYGLRHTAPGDTLKGKAATEVTAFLQAALDHQFASLTLSEVGYDSDTGVIALSQDNGVKLLFGHNDFDRALRNWEAFYQQVVPHKGMNKLASVDLRFVGQVVTKDAPKYLQQ